ncbi:MAG: hypothetical protein OEY97_05480 [Nitrospirota bacterium]|nr:hypothetical protein [Nitrospirota bacterium]
MFDDATSAWEYRVEQLSSVQLSNQLNFLGKEGWELVTVLHNPDAEYPYECICKRRRAARY